MKTVMNIGNRFHRMVEVSRIAEKLLASQEKHCIMEIISIFCNIGSITLVDLQLDAQNSYLFTYNTFINP